MIFFLQKHRHSLLLMDINVCPLPVKRILLSGISCWFYYFIVWSTKKIVCLVLRFVVSNTGVGFYASHCQLRFIAINSMVRIVESELWEPYESSETCKRKSILNHKPGLLLMMFEIIIDKDWDYYWYCLRLLLMRFEIIVDKDWDYW